jgi:tRNA pseudouridine38-40 synthase
MQPEVTRYFMFLSFEGTNYHGWQIQPNVFTVQQTLENALSLILSEKITSIGAGRTDAGVHAAMFCIHFDNLRSDIDSDKKLIFRLNEFLPSNIAVKSIREVIPEANARFSAISRTYKYYILKTKNPFKQLWSWHINFPLNVSLMNTACDILKENSDFTSFCRLHSDAKTNICSISSAEWIEDDNEIVFSITSNRFLRNMVRAIVGTMVDLGSEKISLEDFIKIIEAKDRCKAGKTAPAKGLFLTDINYPENIFISN